MEIYLNSNYFVAFMEKNMSSENLVEIKWNHLSQKNSKHLEKIKKNYQKSSRILISPQNTISKPQKSIKSL
jgi:hypothetical protein